MPIEINGDDIICSQVFPGLWLDKAALLAGNLAKILELLQHGLARGAHQGFVDKLSIPNPHHNLQ